MNKVDAFVDAIGNRFDPRHDPVVTVTDVRGAYADMRMQADEARKRTGKVRATGSMIAVAIALVSVIGGTSGQAQAQFGYYPASPYGHAHRPPLPSFRPGPGMIMPAIRGASRLGWYGGSYLSQRQYGPMANPGPWPGLGPALGIRRR